MAGVRGLYDLALIPICVYHYSDSVISRHDELYYTHSTPEISDAEYDKLIRRAENLQGKFESLQGIVKKLTSVGSAPSQAFPEFVHTFPMLSLDNAFSESDLQKFAQRIHKSLNASVPPYLSDFPTSLASQASVGENENIFYVVEPKIDGLSMAIHYVDGHFIKAGTRGNGKIGEDVTANIAFVSGVPLSLPMNSSSFPVPSFLEVGN